MLEALEILATASFWAAALRIATPLIFGTLGELVCERAGVLNLGIEGIFTAGAMSGWMAVYLGADLWTGVLVAALVGALFVAGVVVVADSMSRSVGVSSYIANLMVATALLAVLLAGLLTRYRIRSM